MLNHRASETVGSQKTACIAAWGSETVGMLMQAVVAPLSTFCTTCQCSPKIFQSNSKLKLEQLLTI